MAATSPSHKRELEELVSEQIQVFKNVATMDDSDILEYHLRHFRIMVLYRDMDRSARTMQRNQGWLTGPVSRLTEPIHPYPGDGQAVGVS